MRLYTRKGDTGETRLLFGGQVSKSDPRCHALGATDTAVSAMGLARALCCDPRVKEMLLTVQREMFTVSAELATNPAHYDKLQAHFATVTSEMVTRLEALIEEINAQVNLPHTFIVPGASSGSGALDLARGLVRTAERQVVALSEAGQLVNNEMLRYLNRLSDLLFILARFEDRDLPFELTAGKDR